MKATLAAIAVLVLALGWTSEAVQVEVSAGLDIPLCLYNCLYFYFSVVLVNAYIVQLLNKPAFHLPSTFAASHKQFFIWAFF